MIVLNEKIYAEQCLENGTIDAKPYFTLNILATYFYHVYGYRNKQISHELTDFFDKNSCEYSKNKSFWDETIDTIAKKAGKYPLHEIDGVRISQKELATIYSIHNKVLEKLAFTLLCLSKLNNLRNPNNSNWVNYDYKDVFKMARITCNKQERYKKMGSLVKMGLLNTAKRVDSLSVQITFADSNTECEDDLFINDFRELGYEYLLLRGENLVRCQECGILIRGNKAGTKKYCSACAAYTPQETKKIICIDCGKEIEVDSKNTKSCRCVACQATINREKKRIWKRNHQK